MLRKGSSELDTGIYPSLGKKEWGEPIRYGSANSSFGVRAWCKKEH
jgi:hypothetical protein